jgi:hypothetical protein
MAARYNVRIERLEVADDDGRLLGSATYEINDLTSLDEAISLAIRQAREWQWLGTRSVAP